MGNFLLPMLLNHWKGMAIVAAAAAIGAYIAFLHHTINNDQEMLDVAHDKMVKMSAEYKADVDQMAGSIRAQNDQVVRLMEDGERAHQDVATANQKAIAARKEADAKVNTIISGPVAIGCDNSILDAIHSAKTLTWDDPK